MGIIKSDPHYQVKAIHNEQGYKSIRKEMARQYDYNYRIPDIQVVDYDHDEKRSLLLHHYKGPNGRELSKTTTIEVLNYIAYIWGYEIQLDVYTKQEKFINGESVGEPFQKVNGYKSTSTDGTPPPPEKPPAKNFGYWGMMLTSDDSSTIDKIINYIVEYTLTINS